jgi:hypothetical protein
MDFFKNGVPASMIATLVSFSRSGSRYGRDLISHLLLQVVVTVGFILMKAIGSVFLPCQQQTFRDAHRHH